MSGETILAFAVLIGHCLTFRETEGTEEVLAGSNWLLKVIGE
jgi:hypothetical protein